MARPNIKRMIRVDQAGEYGATRIYAGQLAVMGERGPHATEIRAMAAQEDEHLARFDALIAERNVRPTALQPFWSVAGYALGAATALIGPKAAMACTAAVEEEIDRHYTRQLEELEEADTDAGTGTRDRQVSRGRAGAPCYRSGRRGRESSGLSPIIGRDPVRLQTRYSSVRARVTELSAAKFAHQLLQIMFSPVNAL